MAHTARKAGESAPLAAVPQLDNLTAFNNATADAFMKASKAYWDSLAELNEEISAFFTKRVQHDMELSRSITGCDDWQKAADLQQNWARTAMEDYMAETMRLMQIYSQASMAGWQTLGTEIGIGSKARSSTAGETPEKKERAA